MKKKIISILVIAFLLFSISISSFAMGNVANGVRNVVGGTENVIENAGNTVAGGVRNGFNTIGHGTENVINDVRGGVRDTGNTVAGMTTTNNNNGNNNNGYQATRTATGDVKIAGMTTNAWSWLIVGITAAAIVILVWSYVKQKNRNDIYIDSDEL